MQKGTKEFIKLYFGKGLDIIDLLAFLGNGSKGSPFMLKKLKYEKPWEVSYQNEILYFLYGENKKIWRKTLRYDWKIVEAIDIEYTDNNSPKNRTIYFMLFNKEYVKFMDTNTKKIYTMYEMSLEANRLIGIQDYFWAAELMNKLEKIKKSKKKKIK